MSKRVIAYEDDPALRKQLESIFYSLKDEFDLIATFPNPVGITAELNHYQPDIVLMDLQMLEEDDGLMALYKIKQTAPSIKVMVLTMFDADQKVFNAICLGADGYMLKSDFSSYQLPHEAIRRSLQTILEGGAYLTPSVAKQILKLFSDLSIADHIHKVKDRFQQLFQKPSSHHKLKSTGLTKMQEYVLQGIVDGKTTAQMAREMELSENTINTHIRAVYQSLGVHSRALAIKKVFENRWIS
jgi:DNA-binding NarL/FixJ family response regulator